MRVKGSIDVVPSLVKELDDSDLNRPRSPEIFSDGQGVQMEPLAVPSNNLFEDNSIETETELSTNTPKIIIEENNEDSEDSEEDSDDDVVVAAGNFTLSSMENNMASLSQQNNASQSTSGINLKRNNLLTLTNVPGMSAGSKVRIFLCFIFAYKTQK